MTRVVFTSANMELEAGYFDAYRVRSILARAFRPGPGVLQRLTLQAHWTVLERPWSRRAGRTAAAYDVLVYASLPRPTSYNAAYRAPAPGGNKLWFAPSWLFFSSCSCLKRLCGGWVSSRHSTCWPTFAFSPGELSNWGISFSPIPQRC